MRQYMWVILLANFGACGRRENLRNKLKLERKEEMSDNGDCSSVTSGSSGSDTDSPKEEEEQLGNIFVYFSDSDCSATSTIKLY